MSDIPPIYFYLPESDWRDDMPKVPDVHWEGFGRGIYSWILQTYLYLKASDLPCQLTAKIPEKGIIFLHRETMPYALKPSPHNLLVCVKADQNCHPYAQVHVVQNSQEVTANWLKIQSISEDRYLSPSKRYYKPHWQQPGLIPRNSKRGTLFQNVVYFGISYNVCTEFKDTSWQEELSQLGLQWHIQKKERWHDYTQVDVVIAVRNFHDKSGYSWKPATKLYNAWLAGVPAILGVESAFQAERKSELDYIEVRSASEAIAALKKLKENPDLRQAMVENGKIRAEEIKPENLTKLWRDFIINICIPEYEKWISASNWEKQKFFLTRYLAIKTIGMQKYLLSLIKH